MSINIDRSSVIPVKDIPYLIRGITSTNIDCCWNPKELLGRLKDIEDRLTKLEESIKL